MAKPATSLADIFRDWEDLLEAANDNEEVRSGASVQREALEALLVRTRALRTHQLSCAATRQQATQDLREMIAQGQELARRLRGVARALLGTKSERLVQFRVAPLRSRRNRPSGRPTDTASGENDEAARSLRSEG